MNPSSSQFPISHVKTTNINDLPANDYRAQADYSIRKVNKLKTNAAGRTDEQEHKESLSNARDVRNELEKSRKSGRGPNVVKIESED